MEHRTGFPVFVGIVNHLEPNADGDEMTWDEKARTCYEYLCRLFEKLDPDGNNDGIFDENTVENALYMKARRACMHCEIQEMKKIEKEIDEYVMTRKTE